MFVPIVHPVPAARTLANPWPPDQAVEGAAVPLRPARLGHRGDQAVASPTPRHHPRGSSPPPGAQVRVASDLVSPPEQERPSPGAPDLPGGGRAGRRDSHRLLSHRLLPPERSPGAVPATSPRARSTNTPHAMPLARLRPASGSRGGPSDRVEAALLGAGCREGSVGAERTGLCRSRAWRDPELRRRVPRRPASVLARDSGCAAAPSARPGQPSWRAGRRRRGRLASRATSSSPTSRLSHQALLRVVGQGACPPRPSSSTYPDVRRG